MKKTNKNQSGITLIALVITVIVMLIIAGVAISAITDPEGIFRQAREAGDNYNRASQNEADEINELINKYLNGGTTTPEEEEPTPPTPTNGTAADGSFDTIAKVNSPDTSSLPTNTTKYITWTAENGTYSPTETSTATTTWYDYSNGKWANIKSTANNLEAYWVWIPRFAYKLPESNTAKKIEVTFIQNDGKTGANGETCYYATETAITTGGTGLYKDATALAKGTEAGKEQAWIIHPAFTFGTKQLNGIWVGKFETSSSTPTAANGGGDKTSYQAQIKPGVASWRYIQVANAFTVCENIKKTGGVIGNASSSIDTHMMKNIEWGAVAILSQSAYGVFNPNSANKESDTVAQVWNNSNNTYLTGHAGSTKDASNQATGTTNAYNTGNGPKASTTGTVYGVYDMAGGAWEYVMGLMSPSTDATVPSVGSSSSSNTGFTGKLYNGTEYTGIRALPDAKYYDMYAYGTSNTEYDRGKIGDATAELQPTDGSTWNSDYANFVDSNVPVVIRDAYHSDTTLAGMYAFIGAGGGASSYNGFRSVLVGV